MQATKRYRVIVLTFVWALSALYVLRFVDRGWIPYDEGSLAQSAERVLAGELPHRDFDELYTGGLSFLYALSFETLGVKLTSIRAVLLLFSLLYVPALYLIAARFVPPAIAGLVVLLCVAWSVPNYFAGLPAWPPWTCCISWSRVAQSADSLCGANGGMVGVRSGCEPRGSSDRCSHLAPGSSRPSGSSCCRTA